MSLHDVKLMMQSDDFATAEKLILNLPPQYYIFGQIYLARIREEQGNFIEAVNIIDNLLNSQLDLTLHEAYAAQVAKMYAMMRLCLYSEALQLGEKIAVYSIKHPEQFTDMDMWIGTYYHITGTIYHYMGNLNTAIKYYSKALKIRKSLSASIDIASTTNNLGLIYKQRGNLEKAKEYFMDALEHNKQQNSRKGMAFNFNNLGKIAYAHGNYDESLRFMLQALEIREDLCNDVETSFTLFEIVKVLIFQHQYFRIERYVNKLQILNKRSNNNQIKLRYKLSKALYLLERKNFVDLARAQLLLENIHKDTLADYEYVIYALLNLCVIYIQEFFFFSTKDNKDKLAKLTENLQMLHQIAEKEQLYSTQVEVMQLEAKSQLIQGNFEKAIVLLSNALQVAENCELPRLIDRLKKEYTAFVEKEAKWMELIQQNNIELLIQQSNFIELLNDIKSRPLESKYIKEETPVLFTIINKGGLNIFARKFANETLHHQMVSSLLSAISNFSNQTLADTVETIKHKNHTILLNYYNDYLVAYIFTGPVISAQNKMKQIVVAIRKANLLNEPQLVIIKKNGTDQNKIAAIIDAILATTNIS